MKITSSAPGKLFITGEYAVLDHGPALVSAVNVRAICRLQPSTDACSRIHTPPVSAAPGVFHVEDNALRWHGEPVGLMDAAWQVLDDERRIRLASSAWHISLDSSAFFLKDVKLGLGSSAAALTALLGALWAASGGLPAEAEAFAALKAAHGAWQGGGSGADLAVALAGGTILYRREPRIAAPVALPDSLELWPVWSGESASTARFLRQLAEFEQRDTDTFCLRFAVLCKAAEEAALAASDGDAGALMEAFNAMGASLRALGSASGLPIWSPAHERVNAAVTQGGGLYKPSGAGGGDIGLALVSSRDTDMQERVKSSLSSAGYNVLPLRFGARGLTVNEG